MNQHYIVVKMSSYDPEHGFKEWYELQPQLNEICINLESMVNKDDKS